MRPLVHLLIQRQGQVLHRGSHSDFPLILGRSAESHVSLAYSFVSRNHCSITVDERGVLVRDLGSRHKLTVEGVPAEEFRTADRGRFMIGDIDVEIRLDRGDGAEATRAPVPTKTFQEEMLFAKPDPERRPLERAGGPLVPERPRPAPESAAPAAGAELIAESAPPPAKKRRPLFEGKLGEFEWALDAGVERIQTSDEIAVQGVVSWGPHLHDLRNFVVGDEIALAPEARSGISLPILRKTFPLGSFESQGARFVLPPGLPWAVRRSGREVPERTLREEQRIKDVKGGAQLMLQKQEILSIAFAPDIKAHFRYIRRPSADFPGAPEESTGDLRKGLQVAVVFHLALAALWMLTTPDRLAPKDDDPPRRFARLVSGPVPAIGALETASAPESVAPAPENAAPAAEPAIVPAAMPAPSPVSAPAGPAAAPTALAEAPKLGPNPGLTADEVGAVIAIAAGEIQACYDVAAASGPVPEGRVEYEWTIGPDGTVKSAAVKGAEAPGAELLNQCVLGLIRAMTFPASKNAAATSASIGFSFGRRF